MHIDDYSFGRIVINGKEYTSDLIIFPDERIDDSWWRDKGHVLSLEDLAAALAENPDVILAGTGASGEMKPAPGLEETLADKGIRFEARPTADAIRRFNDLINTNKNVAACLHLTC